MPDLHLTKVLIVEDDLITSRIIHQMLIRMGCLETIIANTFQEAQGEVSRGQFDIAILDINLHGNNEGIILGAQCSEMKKPFFFLTSYSDSKTIESARSTKPGAYILKPFTPEEILVGIEMAVMHQEQQVNDEFYRIVEGLELSERETHILAFLAERLTNAEISGKLNISNNTVKYHLKRLYIKLGITSRSELKEKLSTLSEEYH